MNTQNRIAPLAALSLVIVFALCALGAESNPATDTDGNPEQAPPSNGAISPEHHADALHYVIAADRELYCRASNASSARERFSPCELLRRAAESIQSSGAEFSYALRSLEPIDARNGPQTELEQEGLAFVASHPAENYYGNETLGGRRYVTAVYRDMPATASCVECHSRRSNAARHPQHAGDILGGIVVRIPLEF